MPENLYLIRHNRENRIFRDGTSTVSRGFSIGLCLQGRCILRINGRKIEITGGTLPVVAPNKLIETISVSEDFVLEYVTAPLEIILEHPSPVDTVILYMAFSNSTMQLPHKRMERRIDYFDFLGRRYSEQDNSYRNEIANAVFYAIMLEICDLYGKLYEAGDKKPVRPRQEVLADDFFKLLAENYKKEHNVGFYAEKLHRTPKYLSGAIRRISGKSVNEWINTMLISQSKLMLRATDKTVLEISEALDFSCPSVFVQFFRRNTGVTPLQYRRQL